MKWILVALLLSAKDGTPVSWERISQPLEPDACLGLQLAQPIHNVVDGKIRVTVCVREDVLGERSA